MQKEEEKKHQERLLNSTEVKNEAQLEVVPEEVEDAQNVLNQPADEDMVSGRTGRGRGGRKRRFGEYSEGESDMQPSRAGGTRRKRNNSP